MSFDPEIPAINQLFAEALRIATARRIGFAQALKLDGRLFQAANGQPASQLNQQAFLRLIQAIAADGILTDGETRQIADFLQQRGLTLQAPRLVQGQVDLDEIDLPDV
ncbi:MAG: hypothetical protein VKP62_09730 [Candidatus Sericytochromatia bacterium]|nr:hypothetical protein [Candidatus Sericytochromatia bacterium]